MKKGVFNREILKIREPRTLSGQGERKDEGVLFIFVFHALPSVRITHFREDCQGNACQGNRKKNLQIIPLTNIPLTIPAFPRLNIRLLWLRLAALYSFAAERVFPFSRGWRGSRFNESVSRTGLLARKLTFPFPLFRPCLAKSWICTPMDPKVTQFRVDAFDAVKNAYGRHQNVQKYGLTNLTLTTWNLVDPAQQGNVPELLALETPVFSFASFFSHGNLMGNELPIG
jgi:hypothetical protein